MSPQQALDYWNRIRALLQMKPRATAAGSKLRDLPIKQAKSLKPGDRHYTAYVGPPSQYDFMGASQFRLLCALGLRETHELLDFGCGSLRAGRLFIPYLNRRKYSAIEPNAWLIEDAIHKEIGNDMIRLKAPVFSHDGSFECKEFPGNAFDYVLAQSVFSHTGTDLMARTMASFRRVIRPDGLLVCTFMHTEEGLRERSQEGWVYPKCVRYCKDTISKLFSDHEFYHQSIPWYHPRQSWYLATKAKAKLVPAASLHKLCGPVFFDPAFESSVR
jgi:SAM-dependent methyltransferase